jgi:hypothetical protein
MMILQCSLVMLSFDTQHSKWLWRSSWLHCLAVLCMSLAGAYDLAVLSVMVLFTALNYWREPDYGYRRYVDICIVQLSLGWMFLRNFDTREPYRTFVFANGGGVAIFYAISTWFHRKNDNMCIAFHMLVHITGNLGIAVMSLGGLPVFPQSSIYNLLFQEGTP